MTTVVKAKRVREVPNFFGILLAALTLPFDTVLEDKEITCGYCGLDFTKRLKTDKTNYAKCPACRVINTWNGR